MERSVNLSKRLEEVLLNGHWIANTNYKALMESVTWEQATQKIGTLNTIVALTYHVHYYLAGLLNVYQGGELEIRDKYSFDFLPLTSEIEWKNMIKEFVVTSKAFIEAVAQMPDAKLDEPFVEEKYGDYLRNIEGTIEHCYYHLGQVSLLKKMVLENNS